MIKDLNPWLIVAFSVGMLVLFLGYAQMTSNADPTAFDYDAQEAIVGPVLAGIGGTVLAGAMVAGAINWQLRRLRNPGQAQARTTA